MLQRKVTYRMYPNAPEFAAMESAHAVHCRLTNTLLEEHKRQYAEGGASFGLSAMCRALTIWRKHSPALEGLNAQSLQVTAKRVSLAFQAFFRRVAAGQTPGFPRFKSRSRFSGWGYKAHGDGWKMVRGATRYKAGVAQSFRYRAVRLSGIGTVSLRGRARFDGEPTTAEVLRKGDKWYLCVTFDVSEENIRRTSGAEVMAFDWGLTTLLTEVVGDPLTGLVETVENPRWLRKQLERIKAAQQLVSMLETLAKKASGKETGWPVNMQLRNAYARARALHSKVARQRNDFYHKLTAALVKRFGLIATEELAVKNMSRAPKAKPDPDKPGEFLPNGAAAKAGLNKSILDAAPAGLIAKLRYKAEEAGSKFQLVPTREVKPTQRCCMCGKTQKLELKERTYRCACGSVQGRDENATRTILRYALEGRWWKPESGAGTVPTAQPA